MQTKDNLQKETERIIQMSICQIKNYWGIRGFSYWERELSESVSSKGQPIICVNVGFSTPLCCEKKDFQKTLAVSAYEYANKFN